MIFTKYLDYTAVFFPDSATKLPKQTGINNYPINLINDKSSTLLMKVPVLLKRDLPTFIDVSSKALVRLPLQFEKSTNAIGLEEPSFLTLDARLAFTKTGFNFTKLMIKNYWPLLKPLRIRRLQARV